MDTTSRRDDAERRTDDVPERDTTVPERGPTATPGRPAPPETARQPVPGIRHEPEPDAGNIMPAEDEPGTL
jgi:hypothetical protein